MIGALWSVGRIGFAAIQGGDALVDALGQYAVKLVLRSSHADFDAGEQMAEQMRADAPELTGLLVSGITVSQSPDGMTTVTASAIRQTAGSAWDYAPFVEAGHGAAAPEPFFYDNADDILDRLGTSAEEAVGEAANEAGF